MAGRRRAKARPAKQVAGTMTALQVDAQQKAAVQRANATVAPQQAVHLPKSELAQRQALSQMQRQAIPQAIPKALPPALPQANLRAFNQSATPVGVAVQKIPGMKKGGMVKKGYNKGGYAKCGASNPPSKKR
jgi:hypothetical protein